MIDILNVDCNLYMKGLPDNYFDFAIVDPPYGINATKMKMGSAPNRSKSDGHGSGPSLSTVDKLKARLNSGSGKLKNRILNNSAFNWDNEVPKPEYFEELFRVSKNQIIWGGNYFNLSPTRCVICWDKCQPWENFSQWEMAWTSFDSPAALFRYRNTGGANLKPKIHPTEKPVALYKFLLMKYAKPGMKIFDSHGGSMNSGIACYDLGYDLVICEKNEVHYNDGKKNVLDHIAKYESASLIPVTPNGELKLF